MNEPLWPIYSLVIRYGTIVTTLLEMVNVLRVASSQHAD